MNTKKLVKAFIAGMTLPAVLLPIIYTLLFFEVHNVFTKHALQFIPMFLPLIWGLANVVFIRMQKESSNKGTNSGLIVTGACLGFLVAVFGVFIAHIPNAIFGKGTNMQYVPLIIVPIIYAILFRYVVKWLNKLLGV